MVEVADLQMRQGTALGQRIQVCLGRLPYRLGHRTPVLYSRINTRTMSSFILTKEWGGTACRVVQYDSGMGKDSMLQLELLSRQCCCSLVLSRWIRWYLAVANQLSSVASAGAARVDEAELGVVEFPNLAVS